MYKNSFQNILNFINCYNYTIKILSFFYHNCLLEILFLDHAATNLINEYRDRG